MDAADARREAVEIARAIIAGELDAIRGAWQLRALARDLVPDERVDEDFRIFVAVVSETDDLPLGHERQHWDESALAEKDRELAAIESRWKPRVVAACANLVRRFGTATEP